MQKRTALILLTFVVFYSWLSYSLISPPTASTNPDSSTEAFSATSAFSHLQIIAKEPHSSGTKAHNEVRDYILEHCRKHGLETELISGTGFQSFGSFAISGKTDNVFCQLKGSGNGKAVLVMSHYDSQPNTPGASDDGIAVAAMMETIEVLTQGSPPQNDIIFLFTDQEETGLLGAEHFVHTYDRLDEIGIVLNFESRGNSGVSFTFETSSENGWVIREFFKAVDKPFANSLAYEVYQLIPNDSDFSLFRDTGISGLNSAFIGGYANYHSMTDTPENANMNTFQHQGDLVLGTVQHFANTDLSNTKSADAIFFSPLGTMMVVYPMYLELPIFIIAILLFITFIYFGVKKKRLKISHMLVGCALYLASIILTLGLIWVFQWGVLKAYPHYTNFYSSNFYNVGYYVLAIVGIGLTVFTLLFSRLIEKFSFESLFGGALLITLSLLVVMKVYVPTGAYIFYVPLLFALSTYIYFFVKDIKFKKKPFLYGMGQIAVLILPLGMWILFVYTLFIVFSFIIPYASALFVTLFFPFLIPFHRYLNEINKNLGLAISTFLLVLGLFLAHLSSSYNEERPLDTELMYAVNADQEKAYWASGHRFLDEWNSQYINAETRELFDGLEPFRARDMWFQETSYTEQETGTIEILSDSVAANERYLTVHIQPSESTNSFDLLIPTSMLTHINDRPTNEGRSFNGLRYHAPDSNGVRLNLIVNPEDGLSFSISERKLGLPTELLAHPKPSFIIHGPGSTSNTIQVVKSFSFD